MTSTFTNPPRCDSPSPELCITCSKYAGFCFGVERAIKLARKAATEHDGIIRTLGPIIHNPQVIAKLRQEGIRAVKNFVHMRAGEILIIRSHGIPLHVEKRIQKRGIHVIDATCPFVKKAQNLVAEFTHEGCDIILIVGEPRHPEVEGLTSYASRGKVHVVQNADDLEALKLSGTVGLLAQTTQSTAVFWQVRERLQIWEGITLKAHDTICGATHMRQSDAIRLAQQSDAIIVVGGRISANTTRLNMRCKAVNPQTYHIETAEELTPEMLQGVKTLGVVTGASTPIEMVEELSRKVKSLCHVQ